MTTEAKTTRGYNQVVANRLRIGVESIVSSLGLTSLNVHERKAKSELIKSLFNYPCSFGLNDTVNDRQDRLDAIQFVLDTIMSISGTTVAMHGDKIRYFVPIGQDEITYEGKLDVVRQDLIDSFINDLPNLRVAEIAADASMQAEEYTEEFILSEYERLTSNEFRYLAFVDGTGHPNDFRLMTEVEMSGFGNEEVEEAKETE